MSWRAVGKVAGRQMASLEKRKSLLSQALLSLALLSGGVVSWPTHGADTSGYHLLWNMLLARRHLADS